MCQNRGCSQTKITGIILMIVVIKEIICISAITFLSVLAASIVLVGVAVVIADRNINGK